MGRTKEETDALMAKACGIARDALDKELSGGGASVGASTIDKWLDDNIGGLRAHANETLAKVILAPDRDYDRDFDVTAGELRAGGFNIGPDIPDCAWVPRIAIRYGKAKVYRANSTPLVVKSSISVSFDVPFRWLQVATTVPRP